MSTKPRSESSTDALPGAPDDGIGTDALRLGRPYFHRRAREIQPYGTVLRYPLALGQEARVESVAILNQVLVDTMTLRDLYQKYRW